MVGLSGTEEVFILEREGFSREDGGWLRGRTSTGMQVFCLEFASHDMKLTGARLIPLFVPLVLVATMGVLTFGVVAGEICGTLVLTTVSA